jgi:hypothetical protein
LEEKKTVPEMLISSVSPAGGEVVQNRLNHRVDEVKDSWKN